jgi:hypothetical protein
MKNFVLRITTIRQYIKKINNSVSQLEQIKEVLPNSVADKEKSKNYKN